MAPSALPASGSVTISIVAPPEVIWSFVSDPATPARFSNEVESAGYADEARRGIGSVIVGNNRNGEFSWTSESTVTVCDEPHAFAWATGDPADPTATWSLAIDPADGGATLTHRVVFHAGRPPLATAIEADPDQAHEIVQSRLSIVLANMAATVAGIARLAEGAG